MGNGKASGQASRSLASAAAANSPTLKIFAFEAALILLDEYDMCYIGSNQFFFMQEIDRKNTNMYKRIKMIDCLACDSALA